MPAIRLAGLRSYYEKEFYILYLSLFQIRDIYIHRLMYVLGHVYFVESKTIPSQKKV